MIGAEPGEGRVFAWAAATFFLLQAGSVTMVDASDDVTLLLPRERLSIEARAQRDT